MNQTVRVDFDDFETESGYDKVRIYDGSFTDAPLLLEASGDRPTAVASSGDVMYVTFTSDSSVTYKGFSGKYTTEKGGTHKINCYCSI